MDVPSISSIISQFPDFPFPSPYTEEYQNIRWQFGSNYLNYIATNDQSALTAMQSTLSYFQTLNDSFTAYQLNLSGNIPNLTKDPEIPGILEYLIETDLESATLQGKLDTIEANINHLESKTTADIPIVIFYAYTTLTLLLGIISICLITYLVYMYMNSSSDSVGRGILSGGRRKR